MKLIKIYTLSHPVTGEVFYVGQTKTSLKYRLTNHVTSNDTGFHLNSYVRSIVSETGLRPIIEEVDTCDDQFKRKTEEFWIQQFAVWGFKLQNRRHLKNRNFIPESERTPKYHRIIGKEAEMILDLYQVNIDPTKLSEITGLSKERIRQIVSYCIIHNRITIPMKHKDAILNYYYGKLNNLVNFYKSAFEERRVA